MEGTIVFWSGWCGAQAMLGFVSVVQTVDTKGIRWLSSPHEMMKRNDGGVPAAADHVGPPSPHSIGRLWLRSGGDVDRPWQYQHHNPCRETRVVLGANGKTVDPPVATTLSPIT